MSTLRLRFGKQLRKIRRNRDITQERLAESIGVTAEFISNIERGKSAPSFETMEKLARVLEVDVSEFFTPLDKK